MSSEQQVTGGTQQEEQYSDKTKKEDKAKANGNGKHREEYAATEVVTDKKKKKGGGLSRAEIYKRIAMMLEKNPAIEIMYGLEFERTFKLAADHKGAVTDLEIFGDYPLQTAKQIAKNVIPAAIMKHTDKISLKPKHAHFNLEGKHANEANLVWRMMHQPISIESIGWLKEKSTPGLCWKRLAFDLNVEGETPHWNFHLSHCEEPEVVMMWIGSIFIEDSSREQYLWMYGGGDDGKGIILSFLAEICGEGFTAAEVPPRGGNKHWKAGLFGKRVVGFSDCSDTEFPSKDVMKALTGDAEHVVDHKGEKSFTAKFNCKFIFASNDLPVVHAGKAESKRALIVRFNEIAEDRKISRDEVLKNLLTEAPAFLTKCKKLYLEKRLPSGRIPCNQEVLEELVANTYSDFETIFETHFCADEKSVVWAKDMIEFCLQKKEIGLAQNQMQGKFRDFLVKRKKVKFKRMYSGDSKTRHYAYIGIKFKQFMTTDTAEEMRNLADLPNNEAHNFCDETLGIDAF